MSDPDTVLTELHPQLRPLAFAIAYRMLGSVAEAEDVVQEAMLRLHRELRAGTAIESPKAYVSAITTRLAIDALRSARRRREAYAGPWLPEPVVTDAAGDVAGSAELADSLSMAFLVVLERLSPVQRAVFLLHDVFDYGYDEVAAIVGKSAGNCRQIAVRARRRIADERPRFEPSRAARDDLADRFFAAAGQGDLEGLIALLAADAVFTGDGGGNATAFPRPIDGRDRVARLLVGIFRKGAAIGARLEPAQVNGQPGGLVRDAGGALVNTLVLDIADGLVVGVRSQINPEKLAHLGPVSDLARRRAR
ncbi:RNA polymerase sigma-70 factor [Baekduia soli]|uniref:RNA polymerase sigma-70 factor n=1 Tax=Baekduia soli TaxID=496014 RepID=A0A5B8UA29_9ACTN|nr:RNA polymerase sigma-70 factor [Baekduia soli]QEC49877.1 RNA polymerase sigma-70 factor [Baekduia soli]